MPGGRPRILKSPEQMKRKAEAYFKAQDQEGRPYTVPGLCLALGFSDRHALMEYAKRPEYSTAVKELRLKMEEQAVEDVQTGKGFGIGRIFVLKNAFGYKDEQIQVVENKLNTFMAKLPEVVLPMIPDERKEEAMQALRDLANDVESDQ